MDLTYTLIISMCGLTEKPSTSGHFINKSTELKMIHITMLEAATKKFVCVVGEKGRIHYYPHYVWRN